MSTEADIRVQVKRNSKKKSGFEVELREDGFFYVLSVPSKKSSIKPGDRVLEINGVKHTDFKSETKANSLIDTLVLDVQEGEEEDESESEDESEDESEANSGSEEY